jgi:hypothetical protein
VRTPDPVDERRHEPGADDLWNESYYFDFVSDDATLGGYVRMGLYPNLGCVWYWACLVGVGRALVSVVDHEVPHPTAPQSLEIRTTGLWADHHIETSLQHATIGLEAFGVSLDDPVDAYGDARGDRVPIGFDLEWETDGGTYRYPAGADRYEIPCIVHGEVLVGSERIELVGTGQRDHSWGVRDWWALSWCWVAGRLDDGTRFHGTTLLGPDLEWSTGYLQPPGGPMRETDSYRAEVGRVDPMPSGLDLDIDGLSIEVRPTAWAPVLLVSPDGRRSRFPRAMCEFRASDGRVGSGWIELNLPQD